MSMKNSPATCRSRCALERRIEVLHQHRAIRQLRQAVTVGETFYLELGVLPLNRIPDASGEIKLSPVVVPFDK